LSLSALGVISGTPTTAEEQTFTVTAANNMNPAATKELTIAITDASVLSSDATLSALTISQGTLTPAFAAANENYTATVPNATARITRAATATDGNAALAAAELGVKSLNVGANAFALHITAEDGTTTKLYTVVITREGSSGSIIGNGSTANKDNDKKATAPAGNNSTTVEYIQSGTTAKIELSAEKLSKRQLEVVGDRPVYDLSITSGGSAIHGFGGGLLTIRIPYALQPGENAEGVQVYYLVSDGSVQPMDVLYDVKTESVIFTTDHLSLYYIRYEDWINLYGDVEETAWFYGAVKFVSVKRLMNGTAAGSFALGAKLTRAMLLASLARLDGVDATVGETWYSAAADWGVGNGVTDGSNLRGDITREQLVTMLYRYAKFKGYDASVGGDAHIAPFTDADTISDWATDALGWAIGAGLINGRTATALAPKGTATRAEVAALLQRFVGNVK
jgi:hypothetical protein